MREVSPPVTEQATLGRAPRNPVQCLCMVCVRAGGRGEEEREEGEREGERGEKERGRGEEENDVFYS